MNLYNKNKTKVELLTQYKDLQIESTLETGDKVLSFSYPLKLSWSIEEEGYIRTKEQEFVIKEKEIQGEWVSVKAALNVEELEGTVFEDFDSTEQQLKECLNLALVGTGWTCTADGITKRRTVRKTNSSVWEIIQEIIKTYRVEIEFDTINKVVKVYETLGSDKGVYFTEELNLKSLDIQSNSHDFYTKIIAKGKDDLRVEVVNNQYSNKVKTLIWKDERYTDERSLKEDASLKLNEISKPYKSYKANIIDLAKLNDKYKDILSYSLGDVITLISKDKKIKEKQRIVKIIEYPNTPEKNEVEIANAILTFEDIQKEFKDTTEVVNNITSDDGTISESAMGGALDKLSLNFANIQELNAVKATIGTLEATKADITELNAINATIVDLKANKAEIGDLIAGNIKFDVASGGTLDLQTLLSKFISGENGEFLNITTTNTTIANAVIKDAMIQSVTANKITSGSIDTNEVNIVSSDGRISIVGATQQFKDKNNKVRIQMGQDAKGNFNFILMGEDGTTALIDHTGIKEKAIADDLIKENMVSEGAIGEKQINYSSLVTGFNKETNTNLLQASKIAIDLEGQSLDIAFNTLKTTVTDNTEKTESNSTSINTINGQINTLIKDTIIEEGGNTVKLKDSYSALKQTVDSINSTVASHSTSIGNINTNVNGLSGKVTTVESKQATLEQNLNGFKTIVSNTYSTKAELTTVDGKVTGLSNKVSTAESNITQLNNKIALKVEATEVNNIVNGAVNNLQIGGRNLAQGTSEEFSTPFTNFDGGVNKKIYIGDVLTKGLKVDDTITIRLVYKYIDLVSVPEQTFFMQLQGYGNVTQWNSGAFNSSPRFTQKGTGEHIFLYSFKITADHLKNTYWKVEIRHDYVQSGSIQYKEFKVEKGNKATSWTPAPEDIDKEITTTNNKVASIETNLNSVTTRVSSTETKVTGLNNNMANVQSRVNSVEQKVTASGVTTTISSALSTGAGSISTTKFVMDKNGLLVKNGGITIQNNSGGNVFYTDTDGNITFKGKLQPNDYQIHLFGNDCRIDGSANAVRLQLTPKIYMAVDSAGYMRIFNQYSNNGTEYISLGLENDKHLNLYNNRSRLKLLGGSTPQVQARNTGDNAYIGVAASQFVNMTLFGTETYLEAPNDINFLEIIKENKIKRYKAREEVLRETDTEDINKDEKIGLILEDLTEEAKTLLKPSHTDGIDIYAMCSILWKSIQEQQKIIEDLKGR